MIVLADLPIDPNVIVVFAMVVFAGIKALLEKARGGEAEPPTLEDEDGFDPYEQYEQYEAELERQRAERQILLPVKKIAPPPLPSGPVVKQPTPREKAQPKPVRPSLSAAEKQALQNLKRATQSSSSRIPSSSTKFRVKKQLASPTAAREALLLSEILGPPKALQTEERR